MYKHRFWLCLLFLLPVSLLSQAQPNPSSPALSFDEALRMAIANDPALQVVDAGREEAYGNLEQAKTRPNPVIEAEVENFLGSGPMRGVDSVEVTVAVSQVIETARKREHRAAVAQAGIEAVDWDRELRIAALEADLEAACVNASLARSIVGLRREQLEIAEQYVDETARLVDAARVPAVGQTKAQLALRQQRLALLQAERESKALGVQLALLIGLPPNQEIEVHYEYPLQMDELDLESVIERLPASLALRRHEKVAVVKEAELQLEQASAKPDVELFTGLRYANEEGGDAGIVAGFSVPWPLFDKNKGNIRAARARLRAVGHQRDVAYRELLVEVTDAFHTLSTARELSLALENDLLPMAEQALQEVEAAFDRGQLTQLDVLDARRAVLDAREALIAETRRYADARTRITRSLAGVPALQSLTQ